MINVVNSNKYKFRCPTVLSTSASNSTDLAAEVSIRRRTCSASFRCCDGDGRCRRVDSL